jgi:hypothetical protein
MPQYQEQIQILNPGGRFSSLNVTAPQVIRSSPGMIFRVVVKTAGSAGNLTINDNTALGGTNVAANQILSVPFGNLTAGKVIKCTSPCANGIVISSLPTGGAVAVSYS